MQLWWLLPVLTLGACALTAVLRRYAPAKSVIDLPNHRSSHVLPTPRGGGVSIVIMYLLALPVMGLNGWLAWPLVWGVFGAGALVALVGFLDDHSGFPVRWRLLAHFAAAFWLLALLPELPQLTVLGQAIELGWVGYPLGALLIVWLLNLYNFMDGIDGIASVEAITTSLGGAALFLLISEPGFAVAPVLLAAAVVGFLYWNLPKARIFLGDSGSGFLGVVLAGLAIQAAWVSSELLWAWLIMPGVFITDTTFALLRRLLRGDRIFEAHRLHAYQYASRRYGAHLPVTLGVMVINVFWLWPWACLVALGIVSDLLALALAYAPLVALAMHFDAGKLEGAA